MAACGRPTAVRAMRPDDVAFTADLHLRTLATGLFPRLGPRFLRAYHRAFLASPHGMALVVERQGAPVAFLLGAAPSPAHRRWVVRRRGMLLAVLGLAGLAVRPASAAWFIRFRLLRYARAALRLVRPAPAERPGEGAPRQIAVLSHLAVDREARGLGAGRALVLHFAAQAAERGARRAHLATRQGSAGAGAFYAGLGWVPVADHVGADGTAVSEYRLELGRDARVG